MTWTTRLFIVNATIILVVGATVPHGLAQDPQDVSENDKVDETERVAPAELVTKGGSATLGAATCQGCYAWASMGKTNAWPGVNVTAKTRNYASEIIWKQEAHLALIAGSACYSGTYKYTGGTGNQYNREDGSLVNSGPRYGGHGTWTNANGHNWWDDGQHWAVNGGADICKNY